MATSHFLRTAPFAPLDRPMRILVTGAAGRIGSYFAQHSHERYQLTLMVRGNEKSESIDRLKGMGNILTGELADLARMKELCQGIDIVLHLAANPSPEAVWEDLVRTNITGTYNIFVAALAAKCRRVVFASSIHAVSGYAMDNQVKTNEPVNPGDLYGVSKCFGEALARYMAEQEGLSAICIRIGACQTPASAETARGFRLMDTYISDRDMQQLLVKCVDNTALQFAIFHGLSDNCFKRLDISDAKELLGYQPLDDLTEMNPELRTLHLRDRVRGHNLRADLQASGVREELKQLD
jgi:NAD(P)-dependent dehydrogenase (short-subunit alcohol dehydrogenase family)